MYHFYLFNFLQLFCSTCAQVIMVYLFNAGYSYTFTQKRNNQHQKTKHNNNHMKGISGSLRKGSANTGLLRFVQKNVPKNVDFEIADLSEIPLYNSDLNDMKDENNDPKAVVAFRKKIRQSDAILFASTEYNYGMSG
ncbi:NADPH-dependent FMN reductase, partial [Reticulomyxa filosa]